ncbi:hypothetical protein ACFQBY_04945 [Promicromonospora citrea]|uniref:Uncharacterized protein n=1 Tax=Promicromonospora citrea TaxID=43677 RepID=A0A8H9L404_9MICO|nr:hypothetical protein [Promicromonospora citrea]GGM24785.1 hypothetical protein GCM10010102_20520 [Promicromonospora citrea]
MGALLGLASAGLTLLRERPEPAQRLGLVLGLTACALLVVP